MVPYEGGDKTRKVDSQSVTVRKV